MRSDLLPLFSNGSNMHAATGKEDIMAFMYFDTGTGSDFVNGFKHKNIIHFKKIQA